MSLRDKAARHVEFGSILLRLLTHRGHESLIKEAQEIANKTHSLKAQPA